MDASESSSPHDAAGSSSARHTESEADKAFRELLEYAAKFQRIFKEAMNNKETGYVLIRVEYDRGGVVRMYVEYRDEGRPREDRKRDRKAKRP